MVIYRNFDLDDYSSPARKKKLLPFIEIIYYIHFTSDDKVDPSQQI